MTHSYVEIWLHIILATKFRARWLDPRTEALAYRVICATIRQMGGRVGAIGGDEDHVHIAATLPATVCVCDLVGELKRRSSAAISRSLHHRAKFRWGKRYSAFSVSVFERTRLLEYIRTQKEHHRAGTTEARHELAWDEEG